VKKGAPKPDISTAAAVKQTLLNAKSIIAIDPAKGSAGAITVATLDNLGLTDQLKSKIKWVAGANGVLDSVAKGETELALGPYTSEMENPGIDIVGALPVDVSTPVDITGFIATNVNDAKTAKALLAFLSSHEVAAIYEEGKIFPAH
jgi:molybdate transport system substrate-binding protein